MGRRGREKQGAGRAGGRESTVSERCEFQRTKGGKMPYTRLVEVGRVAMINYGKDYGKLVVIVDIVDAARALCDAPDMVRKPIFYKRLAITEFKVDIPKIPGKKELVKSLSDSGVLEKFAKTAWGKKLAARKEKASLNDFQRFEKMLAK